MPLFGVRSCPLFRGVKETNTRQKKERTIATGYKQLCFIGCGPPRQHSHSVIDNYTHIPLNAHHKLDFLCKCHPFFCFNFTLTHTHTRGFVPLLDKGSTEQSREECSRCTFYWIRISCKITRTVGGSSSHHEQHLSHL